MKARVRKIIANFVLSSIRNAPRHFSNFISLAFLLRFENFWSLSLSLPLSRPPRRPSQLRLSFTNVARKHVKTLFLAHVPSIRSTRVEPSFAYVCAYVCSKLWISFATRQSRKIPPLPIFRYRPLFSQESKEKRNIIREVKQKFKKILWNSDLSSISNNVKTR